MKSDTILAVFVKLEKARKQHGTQLMHDINAVASGRQLNLAYLGTLRME